MKIEEADLLLKQKFGDICESRLGAKNAEFTTLLTDSRNHFKPEETIFFAINNPLGNDGHKFLEELYHKGVKNFIIDHLPENFKEIPGVNILKVPDVIEALGTLGSVNRKNAAETLAITGSRGKTTIKEMIFQLLEPSLRISRSPRSFNSKIGVPLSLWQISPGTELAVIEAGISTSDEMKRHAEIILPDIVLFTKIGDAHDNGFHDKQHKAKEKALLAYSPSVKTVIYPLDDPYYDEELEKLPGHVEKIRWSEKDPSAELFLKFEDSLNSKKILNYRWKTNAGSFEVDLIKEYDKENIAGTLAFMLFKGFDSIAISHYFKNLHRIKTRLNVSEGINGCSIILDSYTSDLSSLLPAIDFMKRRKTPFQNLTMILSDFHHEGIANEDIYHEISELIKETGISRFIGIGPAIMQKKSYFPKESKFYRDTNHFLQEVSASDFSDEIILLKGSPQFEFEKILKRLEAKSHETVLEVNLDALLRNYNYFRSLIPNTTGIIAMVKASGYGVGSYEIAKTLQDAGAAYLAVAALDEGVDLRNKGIGMPIMVMNPRSANYQALFRNKLEPAVYSLSMLRTLIAEANKNGEKEYPVHIKLDTGMHRMGFEERDIPSLIELLLKAPNIKISSIFSHLATADCLDMDNFTLQQIQRFENMSQKLMNWLNYPVKRHILNSAGILRFPEYHYDLVRLGIGLYGANTLPESIEKPLSVVASLRTVIICIREIEGEEAVGYGRKGNIKGRTKIATLPIGYADGINRHLGNGKLRVLVNGRKAQTIGNICMDATMIDVTGIECHEGDSVEIFGENMSVLDVADTLDTIPYEILTSVSPRVKRIYYRE